MLKMMAAAATGLFLVFVLFTAPLFSMVSFKGGAGAGEQGFIQQQVVDSEPYYYPLRQASAQEESTPAPPSNLPFTPFSLQQQETVPEEEQEQLPTDEAGQSLTQEPQPPTVTEGTSPSPSTTDDGQSTFQARPGQNVPLTPQPTEPTTRQGGDQSERSNATTPSGDRQIESIAIEGSLSVTSSPRGQEVNCGNADEDRTGGGFNLPTPAIQVTWSNSAVGWAWFNGWFVYAKNTQSGSDSAKLYVVCAKITPEDIVNSTNPSCSWCISGTGFIQTYVRGGIASIEPNSQNSVVSSCWGGEEITGGGFGARAYTERPPSNVPTSNNRDYSEPDIRFYKSYPSGNGWAVEAKSNHQTLPTALWVYAICAKVITSVDENFTQTVSRTEQVESNPRYVPLTVSPNSQNSVVSSCREGEAITAGGWYSQSSDVYVYKSYPSGNGWLVEAQNLNPTEARSFSVYAMCARVVSMAQPITPATVPPPTNDTGTTTTTTTPATNDTGGGILDNSTVPSTNATGTTTTTTTTTTPATNDTGEIGGGRGGGFLILDNSTLTGEGLVGGATVTPEPGGVAPTNDTVGPPLPTIPEPGGIAPPPQEGGGGQPTQEPGVPPPTVPEGGGDTGRGPQGGVTVEDTERGPQGGVTVEEDSIKVVPVPTNGFVGDRYEVKSYLRNDIKTPIEGAPWYFCSNFVPGSGCNAEGITYERCDTFSLDPDLAPTGYLPLYCFAVRYSTPGTYLVTAQSHDYQDKRIGGSAYITVREGLPGGAAVAPEPGGVAPPGEEGVPLTVEIIPNATEAFAPATFQFDSKVTGGTEPYNYRWKLLTGRFTPEYFGAQLVLAFQIPGTYTIILNVTDSTGRAGSDSVEITIGGLSELPPSDIGEVVPPPEGGGVLLPPETGEEGGELPGGLPPSPADDTEGEEGTPPSTTTEEEPPTNDTGGG